MAIMPTIKLTNKEYHNLLERSVINYGGESLICKSKRVNTLYKFFNYDSDMEPEVAYPNKKAKIQMLYDMPSLAYSVKPVGAVEVDGIFLGYEMTRDPLDISLADAIISQEEKLVYLHKIKRILDYYKLLGITYGDVRGDNILIEPTQHSVKFCDMDNIQIGNYSFDAMTDTLATFIEERDSIDETADMFMFNLLTLEQLTYQEAPYEEIIERISKGIYPPNFEPAAHRVLDSMLTPEKFTGETIIQYIKK